MSVVKKKCQQIPSQFIIKHTHKYLFKKTLINTKFQWLTKYLANDEVQFEDRKLSQAIKINANMTNLPKQKAEHQQKNIIQQSSCLVGYKERKKRQVQISSNRNILKTKNAENIFEHKHNIRINKSLLFLNSKHFNKKSYSKLLFKKQDHVVSRPKMKTDLYNQSKTQIKNKIQKNKIQSFKISPWAYDDFQDMHLKENIQFIT